MRQRVRSSGGGSHGVDTDAQDALLQKRRSLILSTLSAELADTRRTEPELPATTSGPGGSTAGAQHQHDAGSGRIGADSGLPDVRTARTGEAEAAEPSAALPATVAAWPPPPEANQGALIATERAT